MIYMYHLSLSQQAAMRTVCAKANPVMARTIAALQTMLQDDAHISEVRGHIGDPWNELADQIAKWALRTQDSLGHVRWKVLAEFQRDASDAKWAWLQMASPSFLASLPPLWQGRFLQLDPVADAPLYNDQQADPEENPFAFDFRIATANVLSLETQRDSSSQRTERFDYQCNAQRLCIVGAQETRTLQGTRLSTNYQIFSSGASGRANAQLLGCELWVHRTYTLFSLPDGRTFRSNDFKIHICHADARRLSVHFSGPVNFQCYVLHAPCISSTCSVQQLEAWWQDTIDIVHQGPSVAFQLALCDANAPLDADGTGLCGHNGAEPMSAQGHILQDALYTLQWFVPSTFDIHVGAHTTWSHPNGHRLRRDYVFVSQHFRDSVVRSQVLGDFDLGFSHDDHCPVRCDLRGIVAGNVAPRKLHWNREKLANPACQEAFRQALLTLPMPRWDVSVDDHNAFFETHITQLAQQHFGGKSKYQRDRPLLSDETLRWIQVKRALLQILRSADGWHVGFLRSQLKDIEKTIRPMVRGDQRRWYDDWLLQTDAAFQGHDSRQVFQRLTRLGRKKFGGKPGPRPLPMIQRGDGTHAVSFQESQSLLCDHFQAIEAGRPITFDELVEDCSNQRRSFDDAAFDPQFLPSVEDLWKLISKTKPGKAPGPNGLIGEVFKAGGHIMAQHMLPLFAKAIATSHEPLQWKGGALFALYKGKGPADVVTSFRSIFLSNFQSKIYHGWVRTQLEVLWNKRLSSIQFGGRKGCGTDMTHHMIQSVMAASRANGHSCALMFLDLSSAFYTVQRAMLFDEDASDEVLCQLMQQLGITPDDWHTIVATTTEDYALEGLAPHAEAVVSDMLRTTFFTMQGISTPIATHRGTRPGDPVGDILFNLAFTVILRDARSMFQQSYPQAQWIGDPSAVPYYQVEPLSASLAFAEIAFVDDVVQIVYAHDAHQLLPALQTIAASTHDAAAKRGLQINYGAGKTEAIFQPRGPGSRKIKDLVHNQMEDVIPIVTEHSLQHLRLVPTYKHLGTFVQYEAVTSRDRRHRVASAKQAFGQLKRSFFAKKNISQAAKTQVFNSLVMPRLCYNVHTWSWLTDKERSAWADATRPMIADLAKPALRRQPSFAFSTTDLFALAGILAPEDMMHLSRLRYWKRMISQAPICLWMMLTSCSVEQGWFMQLMKSFQWLQTHSSMPFACGDYLEDWVLCASLDDGWALRLKKAAKSCLRHAQLKAQWKVWHLDMQNQLLRWEGPPMKLPTSIPARFRCNHCLEVFGSRRALALHTTKMHGYRRVEQYYLHDEVCWSCKKNFHTRARAIIHLHTVPHCLEVYKRCFPPMSEEKLHELDSRDQQEAHDLKLQGWAPTKAFCPPRAVIGPGLPTHPGPAADRMHAFWLSQDDVPGTGFQVLDGCLLQEADAQPDDRNDDIIGFVAHTAGGTYKGLMNVFEMDGAASLGPQISIKTLLFVHFFSGYRRPGDLQHQIENHIIQESVHVFCLSIDLCLAKSHSDLTNPSSMAFWKKQVDLGNILGLGGGPSCETWSAARYLPDGPTPLRSHHEPWGLAGRTLRQFDQIEVGTRLLFFLLELLLYIAPRGLIGFLEHPAYPTWLMRRHPSSLWSTPFILALAKLSCFQYVSGDQCLMGCCAKKPTTFLLLRMPSFRHALLNMGHGGKCNHRFRHQKLQGRLGEDFATARAKVYPIGLNRMLADAVLAFVHKRGLLSGAPLSDELLALNSIDETGAEIIQPDYHRWPSEVLHVAKHGTLCSAMKVEKKKVSGIIRCFRIF